MAVFYRIHAQSRVLEEALRAANIPYQIVGGTKFYDRAGGEGRPRVPARGGRTRRATWISCAIVNVPARGIGQTTVDRLTAWATANDRSLFDALAQVETIGDLGAAAKKKLAAFRAAPRRLSRARASRLAERAAGGGAARPPATWRALKEEDSAEADARVENLQELVGSMQDYEAEAGAAGEEPALAGFLERVTLVSDVDAMAGGQAA